jgi:RNA polymerase sigma-70 factor (ECF subfamily)
VTTLLTSEGTRSREALDDDVDLARDRVLVTRAQAGDRAAFDDLYVRYYRRLYRFCLRRLHDAYEAEDVAQEAFARAWRALPTFAGDRRFYPWLSVIAAHLCTDVLRRRNRSTPVAEFHQGNIASTEDGGEELMVAAVDSDLVARAFQRLSDRHQRILNLREGSGWSYQRIADHEGVGITAVETLLWRARQALKREFAALAGAEGRTAAWIGGILSLAALRRALRALLHAARRFTHFGVSAPTVAVGSAAAATAMVVAASLSGAPTTLPGHTTASAASAPGGADSAAAAQTRPSLFGSPGSHGQDLSGATGASSGSGTGGTQESSLASGTQSTLNGTTGSLGSTVNSATGGVGSTVGGTAGPLTGTLGSGGASLGTGGGLLGTLPLPSVGGTNTSSGLGSIIPTLPSIPLGVNQSTQSTPSLGTGVGGLTNPTSTSSSSNQLPGVSGITGSAPSGSGSTGTPTLGTSSGSTSPVSSTGSGVSSTVTTLPCTVTGVVATLTGSGSGCPG